MAIQKDKLANLEDAQVLYNDLRDRIESGAGGAGIDDTAGAGVTDKAWSADKLVTEFGNVVKAQDTEPTTPLTEIWFPETPPAGIQVPTWDDHVDLDNAKAPVILDSASGAVASFPDGADNLPLSDCTISIEPVQDLHGQENPYPAGGSANKAEFVDGYNIPANGVVEPYTSTSRCATLNPITIEDGKTYYVKYYGNAVLFIYSVFNGDTLIRRVANISSESALDTSGGDKLYVCAYDGTVDGAKPLVAVNALPTSYAPYSNICPISGWTGAIVTRTGKNLFDDDASATFEFSLPAGTYYAKRFRIGDSTTEVNSRFEILIGNVWTVVTGTSLDNGNISLTGGLGWGASPEQTITLQKAYRLRMPLSTINGYRGKANVILSCESMPTAYVPYNGTTYPISWQTEAGTVYGGTLDVTTGVLTVDKAIITVEDISNVGTASTGIQYAYKNVSSVEKPAQEALSNNNISSAYKFRTNAPQTSGWFRVIPGSGSIDAVVYIFDERFTTVDIATGILAQEKPAFCYKLATPITYQLTATEIKSLLGQNHVFADCGNTSVIYRADTKLFCQKNDTVDDVQINGTSILSNGVANIPIASADNFGILKIGSGLYIGPSSGKLQTNMATSAQMKAGSNNNYPIVPSNQHESVFYGLAKASGDTSQSSSSNAVGVYTADALVKIQKMLGIYEAPWELIGEDTFTNATEADYEITVDSNGENIELTDLVIQFETPKSDSASAAWSGSGAIDLYPYGYAKIRNEHGAYTQSAGGSGHGAISVIRQHGKLLEVYRVGSTTTSNTGAIGARYGAGFNLIGNTDRISFNVLDNPIYIYKIVICAVTGTGHYKLYGKRKWTV